MMIRKANVGDLEALLPLYEGYLVFYEVEVDSAKARAFLQERLTKEDSEIYLCEDGGEAVGFVQLYPLYDSLACERLWMLNDLYVKPECRRHGYGEALITQGQELARQTGAAGCILDTAKTNVPGNHLYPKMGFKQILDFNFYRWDA